MRFWPKTIRGTDRSMRVLRRASSRTKLSRVLARDDWLTSSPWQNNQEFSRGYGAAGCLREQCDAPNSNALMLAEARLVVDDWLGIAESQKRALRTRRSINDRPAAFSKSDSVTDRRINAVVKFIPQL